MLFTLIRKNMLARPLRYILTGLAIAFGVAAVTAVFIFTDGLRTTFDELGGNIQAGFDIAIQPDSPFGDDSALPPVPVDLLAKVESLPGVAAVQPRIIDFGAVPVDADGESVLGTGTNIGLNWEARTPNPRLFVIEGRAPAAPAEFAIDVDGFKDGNFTVGDRYKVLTPQGPADMQLVGTFNFGAPDRNASVGAIIIAFEENTALELLNGGKGYDNITIVVDSTSTIDTVLAELKPVLAAESDTLVAIDQQQLIKDSQDQFGQILSIFQTVLLVFAAIILIVSAFLIFNVFTITLGQRIKELGLLRSIGAFGSQVTTMMLGEALLLGIIATIVGIPGGYLLARALRFGLGQLGFPGDSGLPIRPQTILYAVFVGVVVTLLAALVPSIRARQITPIAALRDGILDTDLDSEPNPLFAAGGLVGGIALIVLGFVIGGWTGLLLLPVIGGVAIYFGVRALGPLGRRFSKVVLLATGLVLLTIVRFTSLGLADTFGLLGAGAMLTIVGASLVSGIVATPAARIIGYPIPLAIIVGLIAVAFGGAAVGGLVWAVVLLVDGNLAGLFVPLGSAILAVLAYGLGRTAFGAFGLTGQLARENAARNPNRTATTATALMIGLALVTGVTVIGESIKTSVTSALGTSITADWLIQGPNSGPQGIPFSRNVATIVADLPEIGEVVPYNFNFAGFVSVQGATSNEISAVIPELFSALGKNDTDPALLDGVKRDLGITDLNVDDILGTNFATVRDQIDADFIDIDTSADPSTSIWVEDSVAQDRNLEMGDTFAAVFLDGAVEELTVTGIYRDGFIFGNRVIDLSLWDKHLPTETYSFISAATADGVDHEAARMALDDALKTDYPVLTVQDRAQFAAEAESQINQTLATINILLLLSAVIAVLGIAIALSLAVFERTREIGLLRAVGTTRQQTRWMVRWEGVIVAAFGGIVGVIVGVGLGVLATQKMPEFIVTTTAVPIGQLIIYVVIAAITGLGAGAFPAWIAGRMNVLEAISTE